MASADILRAAHTELPWSVMSNNPRMVRGSMPVLVADASSFYADSSGQCEANAAFIVRACNAHYGLLDAAKGLRQHLALFCGPDDAIANAVFAIADAAIAAAEAEAGR